MNEDTQTKLVENTELIAVRVPPGDKWKLVKDEMKVVHPSLMDVLEAYFEKTQFKGDFRFAPREGKIYAITQRQEEVLPEPEKVYNIYGDPM